MTTNKENLGVADLVFALMISDQNLANSVGKCHKCFEICMRINGRPFVFMLTSNINLSSLRILNILGSEFLNVGTQVLKLRRIFAVFLNLNYTVCESQKLRCRTT